MPQQHSFRVKKQQKHNDGASTWNDICTYMGNHQVLLYRTSLPRSHYTIVEINADHKKIKKIREGFRTTATNSSVREPPPPLYHESIILPTMIESAFPFQLRNSWNKTAREACTWENVQEKPPLPIFIQRETRGGREESRCNSTGWPLGLVVHV